MISVQDVVNDPNFKSRILADYATGFTGEMIPLITYSDLAQMDNPSVDYSKVFKHQSFRIMNPLYVGSQSLYERLDITYDDVYHLTLMDLSGCLTNMYQQFMSNIAHLFYNPNEKVTELRELNGHNIKQMMYHFSSAYRHRSMWFMNDNIGAKMFSITDDDGTPILDLRSPHYVHIERGIMFPHSLLGRPVVSNPNAFNMNRKDSDRLILMSPQDIGGIFIDWDITCGEQDDNEPFMTIYVDATLSLYNVNRNAILPIRTGIYGNTKISWEHSKQNIATMLLSNASNYIGNILDRMKGM